MTRRARLPERTRFVRTKNGPVVLRLGASDADAMDRLEATRSTDFGVLARAAGLDPATAFRGRDLSGLPLGETRSNLRGFDFTGADLRGTGVSRAILDATTTLIGAALDIADRTALEARGFAVVAAPSPGTPPEDFDLRKVHQMILAGQAPPPAWRPWVTELDFSRSKLVNLAPLAALANLQTIDLAGTQVADIAPLAALANLQTLSLSFTRVADIAPLAALANLQTLYLSYTQVADIAPLAKLPNLKDVYVERGRVGVLAQTLGRRGVVKLPPWIRMPKAPTTDAPRGRTALSRRSRSR